MRHNILHGLTTLRRRGLHLLALALLAACGSGGATEPEIPVAGSYTLVAVQGEALPVAFLATELIQGEVVAGSLTLTAEGRYVRAVTIRWTLGVSPDTTQEIVRSGSFERTSAGLRFVSDEGLESVGTADGERVEKQALIETAEPLRYTFRRTSIAR